MEKAVNIFQSAVECTRKNHFLEVFSRLQFGYALELNKDPWALQMYVEVAQLEGASPIARINGALHAARFLDIGLASSMLKLAIELLPRISPRTLNHSDRWTTLSNLTGLASAATAFALKNGDSPTQALQLLEKGRGVILSLQLETRVDSDLSALEDQHFDLAQKFRELRNSVDFSESQSSTDMESVVDSTTSIRLRQNSAREFDELVKSIRRLDGFDRFLLGPSSDDLTRIACEGPIIEFTVNPQRSDAFLITTNGIRSLRLRELHFKEVKQNAEILRELKFNLREISKTQMKVRDILQWLWTTAVRPVLDELGFRGVPADGTPMPHVWWVPTGWLSSIPIHAAGCHGERGMSALDRVVSSYAMTLKSLAYTRERARTFRSAPAQTAVFVAMPTTPGQKALPNVDAEISAIEQILPKSISRATVRNAEKTEVLQQVKSSDIVHFACHGFSDPSDPSRSCLYLQDSKLFVQDLVSLKCKSAQLAYLSACRAAVNRSETLLDEGIHLAGTFQLAGFTHVIGSLWELSDERLPRGSEKCLQRFVYNRWKH